MYEIAKNLQRGCAFLRTLYWDNKKQREETDNTFSGKTKVFKYVSASKTDL